MGVLPSSAALAVDEPAIYLVYLARATLGDPSLEAEMLEGFGFRATQLMLRMQQAALSGICAAAQALNGLARSTGAWRVALAAEAVKSAAENGGEPELRSAIDHFAIVVKEARAAITEFLRTN